MDEKPDKEQGIVVQGGQPHGKKLTTTQILAVFVCWLKCDRSVMRTAVMAGVSSQSVSRFVAKGKPSSGIPPFKELVEEYEKSGLLFIPAIHDEALKHYKWSRRRAVAQTLQICEGLRTQVRDAVLSGELKVKTPEDAAKVAQAVKSLEESYTTLAASMNLVEGEEPAPRKAADDKGPAAPDYKSMPKEELEKLAGRSVVPMKKKKEAK